MAEIVRKFLKIARRRQEKYARFITAASLDNDLQWTDVKYNVVALS